MKSTRGFEMPLYFEMPHQFTGDHLLSYGGLFNFTIEMMECETGLDQITVQKFPLVRISAHDSLNLDYFGVRSTVSAWKFHILNVIGICKILFMFLLYECFSPNHFTQVQTSRKRYEWPNCIGDCIPAVKRCQGEFSWPHCRISRTYLSGVLHPLHLQVLRKYLRCKFCQFFATKLHFITLISVYQMLPWKRPFW